MQMVVVLVVVGVVAGAIGSRVMFGRAGGASSTSATGGEDSEQLYSCGMHPNVIQRGPGICPICNMKLTPLKADDGGEGDSGGSKQRKVLYWRAPMNPNYISDKPGKSPMGMDLVPVYADEEWSSSAHIIRIDPVTIQNMGIRTAALRRGPLVKTIRTVGRVDYDEQLVTFINTKFEGWIEKLHVDETGQFVDKGQLLFDVYSRELYSAQKEYLAAIEGLGRMSQGTLPSAKQEQERLIDSAVIKLQYLDVTDEQIDALKDSKQIQKIVAIHSPSRGIVTDKMVLEGMYVKPGMRLYTIADLSRVWVYMDIYEYQLPWIRVGQTAEMTLSYIPGRVFEGQVVYIYPYLEKQTRVIKVRLEFDNPAMELKPNMFANVTLAAELRRDALLIPREAYIDSGTRQVVFVDRGKGKFEPREIQVGVEAEDDMVEVLYGLDEGEVVVTSGQFLLDAESKLKEAIAKMLEVERALTTKRTPHTEGEAAGRHMRDHAEADSATQGAAGFSPRGSTDGEDVAQDEGSRRLKPAAPSSSIPPDAQYACLMEAHPDEDDPASQGPYFSAAPGECPRCGMNLKPLEELAWVKARRAAQGGDVAYTCVDHQHVFSKASGTCPRCGKELMSFKVMYTCPDREHAGVISTLEGNCPRCGQGLAAFRGIWLDESMAEQNVPPRAGMAEAAAFRCPIHPLVHSDREGNCTICGAALASTEAAPQKLAQFPANAKYTCPMKECWEFSESPGECPKCGMNLKPLQQVAWAREIQFATAEKATTAEYACPMHPKEQSQRPGTCSICGMQLVRTDALNQPQTAPAKIANQMDYITEHYLELQRLLASDKSTDVALHALGLASAGDQLSRHLQEPGADFPAQIAVAAEKLRTAALKTTGKDIQADRVTFVDLSAAMRTLVAQIRPDNKRWPKLYIYHCPMSKGDWIQATKEKSNPYYGFKMLKCGQLVQKL